MTSYHNGIDISVDQESPRWDTVKASGKVEFVYNKATEGISYKDVQFRLNRHSCGINNLPFGAYHFFHFNVSPVEQAKYFLSTIYLENGDLIPMVDVEVDDGITDISEKVNILDSFLAAAEKEVGKRLIIYTGWEFWRDSMGSSDAFAGHPLWVSAYNSENPNNPEAMNPGGFEKVTMWQHADNGVIPGIDGFVDMDRLYVPISEITM